jgi:hypothetical protein
MGWLDRLIGSGVAEPIEAIGNAADKIFTSDEERAQAEAVLLKLRQHQHILQAEMNLAGLKHRSIWVAGWRPALGWTCALGLSMPFVINPLLQWITGNAGPEMPTAALMELVILMLGLGGLRTYEKSKGITK